MIQASSFLSVPPVKKASDAATAHTAWTRWVTRFEQYLAEADIEEEKHKIALLIYLAGETVADIFATLPDTGEDCLTTIMNLNEQFGLQKNSLHEIYMFHQAKHEANEPLVGNRKDFEILLQIVNESSSRLGKTALRDQSSSYKISGWKGQRDEASTQQPRSIESLSLKGHDSNQLVHSRKSCQPSRQMHDKC